MGFPVLKPSETGPYDLMDVNIRRRHTCLAKEYGVDAFAYHHYWFYDDERQGNATLAAPLEAMLLDGQPDLPFMLHWVQTFHITNTKQSIFLIYPLFFKFIIAGESRLDK